MKALLQQVLQVILAKFVRRELERSNPFFFAFHEGGQQ